MNKEFHNSNQIHPTALIGENVEIGKFNVIGKNVVIEGFRNSQGTVRIGDCNIINDGTRILAGAPGISIGDWNVFHNDILIMAEMEMRIGHNCWFGQNTILDSSGGLEIGNGVRVGMYSQIWTHVASGELIEGCTLFGKRKTVILDDVWLVGSCIVSSGVTLGKRSIYLIGSNITKNTDENTVYSGCPAKKMEGLNFYRDVTLSQKLDMMFDWISCFASENPSISFSRNGNELSLVDIERGNEIKIVTNEEFESEEKTSVFCLKSKQYTKKLTEIERRFFRYLYNHKARFVPVRN